MGKRKKSSFDDGSDDGRKRKKYDLSEQLTELMESLRNYKNSDGRIICETFIRAPKRRNMAEYYEVVSAPMDLIRIQSKIKLDEYNDLDEFTRDIELIVTNTKAYYKADSTEYADVEKLWQVFNDLRNDIFGESSRTGGDSGEESNSNMEIAGGSSRADSTNGESDNDDSTFEELFSAVMMAYSEDGRQLSTMFELLPSKGLYADYYKVVTEPIDLKMIASRIQRNEYTSLNDIEKDLMLMISNAKKYNAPGSQIYKDANTLRKVVTTKKAEIEVRKSTPAKSSERIRSKRQSSSNPKWSEITAQLKYEEDDDVAGGFETSEDTMNFSDSEDESNPQWLLYNAVKDTTYSETFFRLPSRRHYPDYYKEIKNPISLAQIGKKIKSGQYESTSLLNEDLNLVFDNAMNYNRNDSKIYKDAAKLKKILSMKAKEIINAFMKNEDDGEDDKSKVVARSAGSRTATRKSSKSMVNAMSQELKNVRRSQKQEGNMALKKRMRLLVKAVLDYADEDDHFLIDPFMDKPSKKLYPDYYDIIKMPMDMKTIESNIKNDVYQTEEELLSDFRLMFENCRRYNEDGSQIYQDSVTLENLLKAKIREFGPAPVAAEKPKRERVRPSSGNQLKMKSLYEAVRDYVDPKGRLLSPIFQKLPSRADFPDYYEVIRKPICLERIGSRVKNCIYDTVEDLLSDIISMLDNACKYNEPDSQIFKDALTLQQVALQTKIDLNEDSVNGIPDVKIIIQDLLTNLFISVYNHQDEEGRCFSDSINELSEIGDKNAEVELRTLNFDIIKKNLNQGRYRRLDRFQQDMFEVFERARKMSRTDSQAFEDSIELQQYFIALRNDLCRNGAQLRSSALSYDLPLLNQHIEALRREKVPKEINNEEEPKTDESALVGSGGPAVIPPPATTTLDPNASAMMLDNAETMVVYQDVVYKVGDFVYVTPNAPNAQPHIIYVEQFKRDPLSDQTMIYGCWFYRPYETFHIPTRRFLEREVFKTDSYTSTPLNQVIGKCCVMFVKDYFRAKPINFGDADVFVCESRYSLKGKSFKKIKAWPYDLNEPIESRDVPLEMNRVPSVFKDQTAQLNTSAAAEIKSIEDELLDQDLATPDEEDAVLKILDVPRPNVLCAAPEGFPTEGVVYYEQYSIPAGTFRVGDCCYVRTDQERNLICRIDRMWTDGEGNPYFHGPWFVQQAELPPNTMGSFYPQEVFLSSIEDTNPLLSICERCAVIDVNDYTKQRPTEFLEKDVYVCEIRYLEHDKRFEPLPPGGLLKFTHQNYGVVADELYFFRKPLQLQKDSYTLPQVLEDPAPTSMYGNGTMVLDGGMLSTRASLDIDMNEESNMSSVSASGMPGITAVQMIPQFQQQMVDPNGVGVQIAMPVVQPPVPVPTTPAPSTPSTPSIKKPKTPKRLVTGYIIFASEVRKSVVEANPECSFGDISRIIGAQWKVLSQEQKSEFEQRAAKQNAEVKEAAAAETALLESLGVNPASPAVGNESVPNGVFECHWEQKCDFQFEDVNDLFLHLTAEPNGHVWVTFAETRDKEPGEFQCMFHGCGRVRKGAPPFPTVQRLVRHCKEVHINKATAKIIDPEKRSRNYVPSSKRPQIDAAQAALAAQQAAMAAQQAAQVQQVQMQQQMVATPQQVQMLQGQTIQTAQGGQITLPGGQTLHHQQGGQQYQTIQIAGPPGHPNQNFQTIVTTQPGCQPAFLSQQGLVGTATIGGQTIQIQQPNVVSSVPQQVHFAAAPQQAQAIQIKPQMTMCLPSSQAQPQMQQASGSLANSSICSLHPTLSQAISASSAQHSTFHLEHCVSGQGVQVKPVEPLFMAPPKTNRLVHTTTYMKYIESLKPGRRYMTNWEKQLAPSTNGASTNGSTANGGALNGWLANGQGTHKSVSEALWSLRDFILKDSLNLANL